MIGNPTTGNDVLANASEYEESERFRAGLQYRSAMLIDESEIAQWNAKARRNVRRQHKARDRQRHFTF